MATYYRETPDLAARVITSDAIVIGEFGNLIGLEPDRTGDVRRVEGLFEFNVREWIKGESMGSVYLRILGEGSDEQARWLVSPRQGRRLVLLLARDVRPDAPEGVFTPIYSSAFELDDKDKVNIPQEIVGEEWYEIAAPEDSRVTLERFREYIATLTSGREAAKERIKRILQVNSLIGEHPVLTEVPTVSPTAVSVSQATIRARLSVLGPPEGGVPDRTSSDQG